MRPSTSPWRRPSASDRPPRSGPGGGCRDTPEELARIAYRKHVRLARLEGGGARHRRRVTAAPDLVALIWIQSRMVFYIAAASGYDPKHPMRPAELLALLDLYATPAEARRALDGMGKRTRPGGGRAGAAPRADRPRLHLLLARYLAKRLARHYAGRLVPLIGAPIARAFRTPRRDQGARPARAGLLRRAIRPGRRPARRRRRGRRVVGDEEADHLGDRRRVHPLRVVGIRLGLAVGRRVDDARAGSRCPDAVAPVLGVERLHEGEQRRLAGDVAGGARRTVAARPARRRPRRRPCRARSAAASPRAREGRRASGSARSSARTPAARSRARAGPRRSRPRG